SFSDEKDQQNNAIPQQLDIRKVLDSLYEDVNNDKQRKQVDVTSSSTINGVDPLFPFDQKKLRARQFRLTCPLVSRQSISNIEDTYGVRLDSDTRLCEGPYVILHTHLIKVHKLNRSCATTLVNAIQEQQIEQNAISSLEMEVNKGRI
ncbi:unnamed protein product, partial [Didymodactylos carnosus]